MTIEVVRKDVKHLRLAVLSPTGRVRVSAPLRATPEQIHEFAASRLGWIRTHQIRMHDYHRAQHREYVDGEGHQIWGRTCTLRIVETAKRPSAHIDGDVLHLRVRSGSDREAREAVVLACYRRAVETAAGALIETYEPLLGVSVSGLQVRRMRTRWGSCTPKAGTIRLNLELGKRSPECLHYVVVHEMVHLLEPTHGSRFRAIMDDVLPRWRETRALLNSRPPV